MSKELLKQAIKNLKISDIHLRSLDVKVSDTESFVTIKNHKKVTQSYKSMVKIEEVKLSSDAADRLLYIFRYAIGVRLVKEEDGDDVNAQALVSIEAEFDACYFAQCELEKPVLEAFSFNNVGYNVWPYWREIVQGSCSKLGINPIRVPFYKLQSRPQKENES
ncbi:TPA: hypothetical protein LSH92_001993 [Citrobacter koseri]|nr:hypothetical protein [Citrobacter koseri]